MTPERLAKIRALAEDPRGDPATRMIAQTALKRYAPRFTDVPHDRPAFTNQLHPGMKTSPEYDRYKFMNLGAWKRTSNDNLTIVVTHGSSAYRIVLFKHKKTPTWGWMRIDMFTDVTEFSGKFKTITEAHAAAWNSLTSL